MYQHNNTSGHADGDSSDPRLSDRSNRYIPPHTIPTQTAQQSLITCIRVFVLGFNLNINLMALIHLRVYTHQSNVMPIYLQVLEAERKGKHDVTAYWKANQTGT